jgi:hypothetical protein
MASGNEPTVMGEPGRLVATAIGVTVLELSLTT